MPKRLWLAALWMFGCADVGHGAASLVNGSPSTDASVVAVIHTRPDGTRQLCSGTVIAARAVLTAKHCVFEDMGGAEWVAIPASRMSISLGDDIVGAPGASIGVSEILTEGGAYRDGDGAIGGDVAILVLTGDAPATPRPVSFTAPLVGDAVTLVGFGFPEVGGAGAPGVRRSGSASITALTAGTLTTEGTSWTCTGDSGGPAFDGAGAVIGVTSIGPRGCPASVSISTRVDRHETLLARVGLVPETDAGISAGDAGAGDASTGADAGPPATGGGCRAGRASSASSATMLLLAAIALSRRKGSSRRSRGSGRGRRPGAR